MAPRFRQRPERNRAVFALTGGRVYQTYYVTDVVDVDACLTNLVAKRRQLFESMPDTDEALANLGRLFTLAADIAADIDALLDLRLALVRAAASAKAA